MQIRFSYLIFLLAFMACKSNGRKSKAEVVEQMAPDSLAEQHLTARAPIMVYKTKADYNNLVPVILDAEKTSIISYPQASDLLLDSGFATPLLLNDGYLLDRRGINENVAFLNISYRTYGLQKSLPRLDVMLRNIVDNDPLTSLCNCSQIPNDSNLISRINELIESNTLRNHCKVIK